MTWPSVPESGKIVEPITVLKSLAVVRGLSLVGVVVVQIRVLVFFSLIHMCQGINSHYFHIIGDKLINPIVWVYILIIWIPIKGGMTIPKKTRLLTMAHMKSQYLMVELYYIIIPSQTFSIFQVGEEGIQIKLVNIFFSLTQMIGCPVGGRTSLSSNAFSEVHLLN